MMSLSEHNEERELADSVDPVELRAAEWLVSRNRGLTASEQREFSHWLQSDVRHSRVYASLEQAWSMMDGVPADRLPLPSRHRRAWRPAAAWAAAASLAVVFFVAGPSRTTPPLVHRAVTPIGGFKQMDLPDGSVVRVNTDSEVKVAFTESERGVHLMRGEASFVVSPDTTRPFLVRVGQVNVRAVGTVFNIRQRATSVEVLVTEGKVRVDDATSGRSLLSSAENTVAAAPSAGQLTAETIGEAPEALLVAGQRATIPIEALAGPSIATVMAITPDEASRTLAWQERFVEFSSEPLANIVEEFNRYNRHRLVVADDWLAQQRFGGKFPAHDVESLVYLLETNFKVVVERRKRETILHVSPPNR